MRSALLSVNGVTQAKVTLEPPEALVTYDPARCGVDEMIEAVGKAEGVESPNQYSATVKERK